MDVVHWDQSPADVPLGLPHSRKHAACMSQQEFRLAVATAERSNGFSDAIDEGANTNARTRNRECAVANAFSRTRKRERAAAVAAAPAAASAVHVPTFMQLTLPCTALQVPAGEYQVDTSMLFNATLLA